MPNQAGPTQQIINRLTAMEPSIKSENHGPPPSYYGMPPHQQYPPHEYVGCDGQCAACMAMDEVHARDGLSVLGYTFSRRQYGHPGHGHGDNASRMGSAHSHSHSGAPAPSRAPDPYYTPGAGHGPGPPYTPQPPASYAEPLYVMQSHSWAADGIGRRRAMLKLTVHVPRMQAGERGSVRAGAIRAAAWVWAGSCGHGRA
jgi:hypothetical protein